MSCTKSCCTKLPIAFFRNWCIRCCTHNYRPITMETIWCWNYELQINKFLQDPSKPHVSFTLSAQISRTPSFHVNGIFFNINCSTYVSSTALVVFKKYLEASQHIVYFLVGIFSNGKLLQGRKRQFLLCPHLMASKRIFLLQHTYFWFFFFTVSLQSNNIYYFYYGTWVFSSDHTFLYIQSQWNTKAHPL